MLLLFYYICKDLNFRKVLIFKCLSFIFSWMGFNNVLIFIGMFFYFLNNYMGEWYMWSDMIKKGDY